VPRLSTDTARMPDLAALLSAPDYGLARIVLERGLGVIYLIAFVVVLDQFPALNGEHGLERAPAILRATSFLETPSVFHIGYSDRAVRIVAIVGIGLSALVVLGIAQRAPLLVTMLVWFALWALYQSIVNIGGSFYGFGWETLLLEAGFLAIFLGNDEVAPPWLVILAFRWLAFRVELGAGLIKLRGDPCWRDLTCMDYHHETQPLPNPLSWLFDALPRPLHRTETIGNFVAQLVLPWGLFLPQPLATVAAVLMLLTQGYLVVSGNYAWLNWITILVMVSAVADPVVHAVLPVVPAATGLPAPPGWFLGLVVALAVLVVVLSYRPVMNLVSPNQAMNASFDPFRLVNTYGAFGSVSRTRYEVIVEGTVEEDPTPDTPWLEYEFRAKPGDPRRTPPQVAPYHYRLDWLMWFLPLSPLYGETWFMPFLARLLQADRSILRLLRRDPFGGRPPVWVRARLFEYRFTTPGERRATGRWWDRKPVSDFVPPIRLRPAEGA
jgi:Lipase maturation factor